ncbi:MAG TPA: hypothetical protein VFA39_13510 [Steroidobacteraceae bacterium]|nr:hypothetical protein [Steroidobacteraceae bacterium]
MKKKASFDQRHAEQVEVGIDMKVVLRHLAYCRPDERIRNVIADIGNEPIQKVIIAARPAKSKNTDAFGSTELPHDPFKVPDPSRSLESGIHY